MPIPRNIINRGESITVPWEFEDIAWARPSYPFWTVLNQYWHVLTHINKVDPGRNHAGDSLCPANWMVSLDEIAQTLTVQVPGDALGGFYAIQYQPGEPENSRRYGATIYIPCLITFAGQEVDRGDGICQTCSPTSKWHDATRRCW